MKTRDEILTLLVERLIDVSDGDRRGLEGQPPIAGLEDAAVSLLRMCASEKVFPEAWEAIMKGEIHPRNAEKFRAVDANSVTRSRNAMDERASVRWARKMSDVEAAREAVGKAMATLNEAEDQLERERINMLYLRLYIMFGELARWTSAAFAAGPAWAILVAISLKPEASAIHDRSLKRAWRDESRRLKGKLSAYVGDDDFLLALRRAVVGAVSEFEAAHPDRIQPGKVIGEEDIRGLMARHRDDVFGADEGEIDEVVEAGEVEVSEVVDDDPLAWMREAREEGERRRRMREERRALAEKEANGSPEDG